MSYIQTLLWSSLIATLGLIGCAHSAAEDTLFIHTGDEMASVISKLQKKSIGFIRIDFTDSNVPHSASFMLYAETKDAINPRIIAVGFDRDEKVVENGVQTVSAWTTKPAPQSFFLQR